MATWPTGLYPASADYSIEYDVQISTMRSGRVYTFGLPGARWVATLTFAARGKDFDVHRAAVEALIVQLRGGARQLTAPHLGRLKPNGTLTGSPQLAAGVAPGANTLSLKNCNGTLKAGDLVGVGGQLLMVEADRAPVSGAMTVPVSPAVRISASTNAAVVWNAPTVNWIPRSSVAGPFPFLPGSRPQFSIELVEVI